MSHRDPNYYDPKCPCPDCFAIFKRRCGCGEDKWAEYDARGIFLTYVCIKCRKEKLRGYRPEVLTDSQYEADDLGDEC